MSIFAKSTLPPPVRAKDAVNVARLYAAILVVMVVGQLFSFEKFIPLVTTFQLPGGEAAGVVVAALIVTCEVLALPFLLRMRLSPAMRALSMVCGVLAATAWLKLTIWLNVTVGAADSVGFLGTSVDLPVGWWAVCFSLALLVLSIWVGWGMWPFVRSGK